MPKAPSPARYAQAVFQIALERDELDVWLGDLEVLAVAVDNSEFSGLLNAPQVPTASKIAVIKQALGDTVGPLALNLLSILASRNLAHLVPGILDEYGRTVNAHRGIERAEVVTAVTLNAQEQEKVEELLEGIVGMKVRLSSFVEPRILGGLIARVGDRVIDGSVRTKLEEMRRSIVERTS